MFKRGYMPYIERAERDKLEAYINDLAEDIARRLSGKPNKQGKRTAQQEEDISGLYKEAILDMADTIIAGEGGKALSPKTPAQKLARQVLEVGRSSSMGWLGGFQYSVTRIIQAVPHIMVVNLEWQAEFRYFLYALTAGAIEQSALEIRTRQVPTGSQWVVDGLVGALFDTKDEYKRRVNIPYEAIQIKKSGDCYDVPFRTEVVDAKDAEGNKGFQEIMRDFRGVTQKKSEDKSI